MDILALILLGIRSVSTVLANPALGGGSNVKFSEAGELLALLANLIAQGADAHDDLEQFTAYLKEMADTGRAPTPAEWTELRARSDQAHARLQAVKETLLAEEETPEEPPAPPEAPSPTTGDEGGGEPAEGQDGGEPTPNP